MPGMQTPDQPPPPPFPPPPVGGTPPVISTPRKKSGWPWILGCGCLTLILIAIAVAGVVLYRYRPQKDTPSSNRRTEQPAPEDKRSDWKTYDSTKANIAPELEPHFVGFRVSYPPTFVS